ncbi:MAG: sugar transferase [Oscillospiraceae bacterium]|nr:sugar transferase [Oscillospiraceae bacterium]
MVPEWQKLPKEMAKNEFVKEYFDILKKRKKSLYIKRIFDLVFSLIFLVLLFWFIIIISLLIILDSPGGAFFKQKRVTQYGNFFYVIKFRTMKYDTEKLGFLTCQNDNRITNIGKILRKFKIDEIPQLINILLGQMTFVGTRPEVPKYIKKYSSNMVPTLLLPAGVTSEASINFRNEKIYFKNSEDYDDIYINKILPEKMYYNLNYIKNFNFFLDLKIMLITVLKVTRILK